MGIRLQGDQEVGDGQWDDVVVGDAAESSISHEGDEHQQVADEGRDGADHFDRRVQFGEFGRNADVERSTRHNSQHCIKSSPVTPQKLRIIVYYASMLLCHYDVSFAHFFLSFFFCGA